MSISNINAVSYGVTNGQGFKQLHVPVNASFPILQGSLVYLDAALHYAKPLDTDAHAASLLGVACQPSVVSSNLDLSTVPGQPDIIVGWDVVASFKTTAAETYVTGTVVYVGADSQTITTVVGSNKVGTVVLPITQTSITGAAGVSVGILVKSNVY